MIGTTLHKETKTITDNDQQQINITKTIQINSILPCPKPHFFYNGIGKLNKNIIKDFLGDQFNNVVGWYKFQKISSYKFSLRDKVIHKQLVDLFEITPELFTCCFLINEMSDNGSTHLFSQIFMRYNNNKYDRLTIHIPNLSEPNNMYKIPELVSPTFNRILNELKIEKPTTQGLTLINKIQNAVQKQIDKVIKDLNPLEEYMHELEEEIKHLLVKKVKKKCNEEKVDLITSVDTPSPICSLLNKKNSNEYNYSLSPEISPERNIVNKVNQKVRGRGKSVKETKRLTKTE